MAEPEPVPVRDLEVADRIAKAVRGGRPADRTPTHRAARRGLRRGRADGRRAPPRGACAGPRRRGERARRARGGAGPAAHARGPPRAQAPRAAGGHRWRSCCSSPRSPRRPPRWTSATTTRRPTCRRAPRRPGPTTATNTVTAGADDVDRPDDLDRDGAAAHRAPSAAARSAPASAAPRERRAKARAKARRERARAAARRRVTVRLNAEPGDLPVRRGRRQAALQRDPHAARAPSAGASCASTSASAPARA